MKVTRIEDLPADLRIKVAARRLFAARGVDGVTTREIVKEAGQKNQGSLNYYFGTKEALVRELIIDGAKVIDERRNRWLDELEAEGGPRSLKDITDIVIFAAVRVSRGGKYREDSYNRFIFLLSQSHRDLFEDALGRKWNSGYQRCLKHLRRLMSDLPEEIQKQRFIFMGAYLGSVLSIRERALTDRRRDKRMWVDDKTLHHFSSTMAAMLSAPHEAGSQLECRPWIEAREERPEITKEKKNGD